MKTFTCNPRPARITIATCLITLLLTGLGASATQKDTVAEPRDHYVPRAGYLRTVDMLALVRQPSFRIPAGAPGLVTSLTGRRAVPTILIEFDNISGPFSTLSYQDHLFGTPGASPPQATISQYYRDMSLGQFEVDGRVMGWFRLPNNDRHYEGVKHGTGTGFGEFLKFGLDQADALVDFGEFDNDGPDGLPNSGDDDGIVDTVFFVHSEAGAECNTTNERLNIWSHSWHYSEPTYGHNGMYETGDVKLDRLQVPELNDDGTEKHIKVEDYTVQPGAACPDGTGVAKIVPIGVFTHEYGHALGLPDLYDRTPSGNPNSNGIGDWGLMAGGSWGFGSKPETPTRMSAWSLARLGWANLDFVDLRTPLALTLEPVQQRNTVHVIDVPGTNGVEYFLLELKNPNWTDTMGLRLNWDVDVPEAGLAIWHVDDSVGASSGTWPFAPRGFGQNDDPSLPNAPKHSLIALEQQDCALNLEFKTNEGDKGDLWETGHTFGAATCQAVSIAYDGTATGITIENIDISQLSADLKHQASLGPPFAPIMAGMDLEEVAEEAEEEGGPAFDAAPAAGRPYAAASLAAASNRRISQGELAPMTERAAAQMQIQASFEEVNASLSSEKSMDALDAGQLDVLRRASATDIEYGVNLEQQKEVKAWASEERQYQIEANYQPQNDVQENLKDLWAASSSNTPIKAQFDPTETRIDRVWGLSLPSGHETLAADAEERKDTTLQPLLGDNVQLQQVSGEENANAQIFQQVYDYGGDQLPVFSKTAKLHYDDNRMLTAISAQTVDAAELDVSGTPGTLDWQTANEIVTQQLGLPAQRAEGLKDSGEGIYLINDDPSQARIVRRIYLPAPGDRPDIVIYIDEETQSVIGIE